MLRLTCPGVSRPAPLSDQLPPIFLGGQTAAQGQEVKMSKMRCTVAICIAALFVLMGPATMAQSGRVVGGGTTSFGTNPGGKYIYRGG